MPSAVSSAPASRVGSFTAEAFQAHLAGLPSGLPSWWLERKRAAYERFASLPLPVRTDEAWRFSNLAGLTLEGCAPVPAPKTALTASIGVRKSAKLVFANGSQIGRAHV